MSDKAPAVAVTDANAPRPKAKPSILKQAALQIVAGGSAGFVEVCIMHPLDLVKTRLQIQNKTAAVTAANANQVTTHSPLSIS